MRTTVNLQNLESCGRAWTLENALSDLENISEVIVNLQNETMTFNYHSKHDFERAKHVLEMLGYPILGVDNIHHI